MTVRIGVVGCGSVARAQHLPSLRKLAGASVVAVADPDPHSRERARSLAPGAAVHADAEELLSRPDVDAVVVASPPSTHAELACATAAAGKHLYLEKPLATSDAEAKHVVDDVARTAVTAVMGFNRRRHPAYEQARLLVETGRIGQVRFARTAFCEPLDPDDSPAWKRRRAEGGGVLLDLASHHFDLLRWFLEAELQVVHARIRPGWSDQDEALTEIRTTNGVEIQSLFSFTAAHADFVELFGDRGSLRVDRHGGGLVLNLRRAGRYGIRRSWSTAAAHGLRRHAGRLAGRRGDPSYARSLAAFVQRVGGADLDVPSLSDGQRSLQAVVEAERLA
jgi:myo-inositol 2-dehydrogenase / D-chiro-inositol 1-dehydrogenase